VCKIMMGRDILPGSAAQLKLKGMKKGREKIRAIVSQFCIIIYIYTLWYV